MSKAEVFATMFLSGFSTCAAIGGINMDIPAVAIFCGIFAVITFIAALVFYEG